MAHAISKRVSPKDIALSTLIVSVLIGVAISATAIIIGIKEVLFTHHPQVVCPSVIGMASDNTRDFLRERPEKYQVVWF